MPDWKSSRVFLVDGDDALFFFNRHGDFKFLLNAPAEQVSLLPPLFYYPNRHRILDQMADFSIPIHPADLSDFLCFGSYEFALKRAKELLRYYLNDPGFDIITYILSVPSIFGSSFDICRDVLVSDNPEPHVFNTLRGWSWETNSLFGFDEARYRSSFLLNRYSEFLHPKFIEKLSRRDEDEYLVDECSLTDFPTDDNSIFRQTVRSALVASFDRSYEGVPAPDPSSDGLAAFYEWLNSPSADHDWLSRFWRHSLHFRPDVIESFPNLESWDRQAFLDWATETLRVENSSPLIARPAKSGLGMRWNPSDGSDALVDMQVVGYLRRESSLGDVARRLFAEIDPTVSQTGMLAYDRTMSPRLEWMPNRDGEWLKAETGETIDTSIIVVNSDQLGYLLADLPMVRREAKSLIGYWYWELETPPGDSDRFDEILDEIWVGSTFVQKSVESGASIPVRYVPLPVGKPETSELSRQDLGLPNDTFVFTTTFDFYSVGERKNPEGSIAAFKEAFPTPSSNVALIIKTMHAKERREEMAKLKALAEERSDIVFVDGVLDREDQHRLIELSDCLVSLHRSEGFGLHLAESMHLGTPVIATRYSANLDFMDDDSSLLVDYTMTHPSSAQQVYSTESLWADPDIKHAAQQMRRLFEDSDLHQRVSRAGKARIEAFDEMARHVVRDHIARITKTTMEPTS